MRDDTAPSSGTAFSVWYLGLGLWWTFFPVFGLKVYANPTLFPTYGHFFDLAWILGIALIALSLALLMLLKTRLSPLFDHPMLLSFSACAMAVGVLLSGMTTQGILPPDTLLFSTVLASTSAAPLMMSWGELLGGIGVRRASASVAASTVLLGCLLTLLALSATVSPWLAIAIPTVSPLLSLLAIVRSWRIAEKHKDYVRSLRLRAFSLPLRTSVAVFVYGIAVGFMLAFASSAAEGAVPMSHLLFGLGTAFSGLLLFLLLKVSPRRLDFATLYRLILPTLSCVLLLLMSLDTQLGEGSRAIIAAFAWGYQISLSIIWSARLASTGLFDVMLVFVKTAWVNLAGVALGMSLWFLAAGLGLASGPWLSFVFTGIVVALILAGLFGFGELLEGKAGAVAAPEGNEGGTDDNRVVRIAQHYGLTLRETEVLLLLAKGRNAGHIQREFVVSLHTVRTHIKRIHSKLSIHSQQELLDLIDRES
jgi:DNA-binding CsgD family transcriptional regulator